MARVENRVEFRIEKPLKFVHVVHFCNDMGCTFIGVIILVVSIIINKIGHLRNTRGTKKC